MLEAMLLKPNMILAGQDCPKRPSVEDVARATLRTLARHVPPAVPGVVFLSGGQDYLTATEHLAAINRLNAPKPWTLTFSYGRALQDEALDAWHGERENVPAAQHAFYHRAKCDSAAALGRYDRTMESEAA
jgi:fructose-bisphosphate aldolase class I